MLAVLRQRNFLLVWLAGLISLTGDWLLFIALPLVVYDLTGSTAATALAVFSRIVPRLLIGSVAGVFVDRWDRRRTMLVTNLLQGCCLLPLLLVRSADWLWVAYLVSFARSLLVPFLGVAEEDLVPANALNGLNNNLARLVGPPLGGLVVAGWGLGGVALLDAASFFIAAALLAFVAIDGRAIRTDTGASPATNAWSATFGDWMAGLALLRHARPIAILFFVAILTEFGEGVASPLFVPFVTSVLGGSEVVFGTIVAAQAVGGLLGSAAIGYVGRGMPPGRLLGLGALTFGLIDLVIYNAHRVLPGVLPPLVLMVIIGLPGAAIGVGYTTLVQTLVADEYRGRVSSNISTFGWLSTLLGAGLAGVLGDRVGIVATLTFDAAAYVLAGLLALVGFSTLFAARSPGADPPTGLLKLS